MSSQTRPRIIIQGFDTVDEATDIVDTLTDAGIKRGVIQIAE